MKIGTYKVISLINNKKGNRIKLLNLVNNKFYSVKDTDDFYDSLEKNEILIYSYNGIMKDIFENDIEMYSLHNDRVNINYYFTTEYFRFTDVFLFHLNSINIDESTPAQLLAISYVRDVIKAHYDNKLKIRNNDHIQLMNNKFAKDTLYILNHYIEELFLIGRSENEFELSIRKEMRRINNDLQLIRRVYNDKDGISLF